MLPCQGEQQREGGKGHLSARGRGKNPRPRAAGRPEPPQIEHLLPHDPHGLRRNLQPGPITRLSRDFPVGLDQRGQKLAVAEGAVAISVVHLRSPVVGLGGPRATGEDRGGWRGGDIRRQVYWRTIRSGNRAAR